VLTPQKVGPLSGVEETNWSAVQRTGPLTRKTGPLVEKQRKNNSNKQKLLTKIKSVAIENAQSTK
jgi:hypothetical protein